MKKILDDIGVFDPIYEPEMGFIEKPELLLTTTDDEVKSVQQGCFYFILSVKCSTL